MQPYESPSALDASEKDSLKPSVLRGCSFGCLYMLLSLVVFGIVFALIAPLIFRDPRWNLDAIARMVGRASFFVIAIPAGLFGYFRHRRKKRS